MTNKDIIVSMQTVMQDVARGINEIKKRESILCRLKEILDYHRTIQETEEYSIYNLGRENK